MGQRLIMLGGTWLLLILGTLPGAVAATGLSEGMVRYRKLVRQGVDETTAAQLAGIEGVVAGASGALPLTGSTILRSAGRAHHSAG